MTSLWESIGPPGAAISGRFLGPHSGVALAELAVGSTFGTDLESLRGRSVLIATREQLPTALALIELDGVARCMVLCTPDLAPELLDGVAATAEADAIVVDSAATGSLMQQRLTAFVVAPRPIPAATTRRVSESTEWILLTSGTTGAPKLVVHTLQSLAGALTTQPPTASPTRWSTFYDIRRYGGLQIYLRAVLSGAPLVISSASESPSAFLARAAAAGVTHMSGTPSHWRRALMSGKSGLLKPQYVRLSGEVADQALLDNLRAAYPHARIAHAFASTEAGVAFDVNDGIAGFPREFVEQPRDGIELKIVDGTLRIRSGRIAARYLGGNDLTDALDDGYVDTGDMVELVDGRYHFRGRVGGIINVGGLKVYPEEIESVLNADSRVRMSLVRSRRSPITGAIVVADVVLADPAGAGDGATSDLLKSELLDACRRHLTAHKVPAMLRFVPSLEFTAAGKLVRPSA